MGTRTICVVQFDSVKTGCNGIARSLRVEIDPVIDLGFSQRPGRLPICKGQSMSEEHQRTSDIEQTGKCYIPTRNDVVLYRQRRALCCASESPKLTIYEGAFGVYRVGDLHKVST